MIINKILRRVKCLIIGHDYKEMVYKKTVVNSLSYIATCFKCQDCEHEIDCGEFSDNIVDKCFKKLNK